MSSKKQQNERRLDAVVRTKIDSVIGWLTQNDEKYYCGYICIDEEKLTDLEQRLERLFLS